MLFVGRLYWIWEWKSHGPTARWIGKSSLRGGHHSGLHSGLRPPFRPSWCPPLREDFPIPRAFGPWDFYNSNSRSGIVASTPIPTQWNWGDSTGIPISKFPTLCSPLKRRKSEKKGELDVTSGIFEQNTGREIWNWNPSGIPPIPLNQNWSCSSNSTTGVGIGVFQKQIPKNRNWNMELWIDPNSFPNTGWGSKSNVCTFLA